MRRALTLLIVCLAAAPLASAPVTPAFASSTTLSATVPSRTVAVGTRLPQVTGAVSGTAHRPVWLQDRTRTGWVTLAQATSQDDGGFALPVPTWWVGRHELRVYAPAVPGYDAVAGDQTGTLTVTRKYAPRSGTAYRLLGSSHARWDACDVITYRVNGDRMPRGALADVEEALRRVSQATGLRFRYVGGTSFVPYRDHAHSGLRNADLALAWAPPRLVSGLAGRVIGLGGYAATEGGGGWNRIVQGFVVLDSTSHQPAGFGGTRSSRGLLLLHELGHALGLDHVGDDRQVMYPVLEPRAAQYAAGDLRGLAAVGAAQGCFGSPTTPRAAARTVAPTAPPLVYASAP